MTAFGVCLFLLLGAFAEMYYKSTTSRSSCSVDKDPREFCNYGASFLKVYAMFVGGIDPSLLTVETEQNLLVLTIFYGFLFAIVMLNVLVAVIFDAWGRVSPNGERIFFQYRHTFLTEAADLHLFSFNSNGFEGIDLRMDRLLLRFHCRPNEFSKSKRASGKVLVVIKYFMDAALLCLLFAVGLLSAGLLWPTAFRLFIFSVGTRDEGTWDTLQTEESVGLLESTARRLVSCGDREVLVAIQDELGSLRSDVNGLVDETQDIHAEVWKLLEKADLGSKTR
jgi:hypothetical protein